MAALRISTYPRQGTDDRLVDAGTPIRMLDTENACLIGHTGFVGQALARSIRFGCLFNSSDIETIAGRHFSLVACCGLPGAKWAANLDPARDAASVRRLRQALATIQAETFVLISTVDVYPQPVGVDETSSCRDVKNHAYGMHRLEFEDFVLSTFPGAVVLRLPALFGRGLRKNAVFDLLTNRRTDLLNPDSVFQWYDVDRLWRDAGLAFQAGLRIVNLVAEPIPTFRLTNAVFPDARIGGPDVVRVSYDVRTLHGRVFGSSCGYVMDADESLSRMTSFVNAARERLSRGETI